METKTNKKTWGVNMENWKQEAEKMKFEEGKSWKEIYEALSSKMPGLSPKQVEEKIRGYLRRTDKYKARGAVGVFSDVHAPFDHPNYPYFLRDTFHKYGVKSVVCLGDIVDNHAISRHGAEPCALGAYSELDISIQRLKIYSTLFPELDYVNGNHDERIIRQAGSVGIGTRFLRTMHDVLELPDGWRCCGEEYINDGVLYSHGVSWCGKNGALNKAEHERMSCCIGHSHAFGGIGYSSNSRDKVFGLNVGCGINREAYAFAYGRYSKQKETLGCGIVFDKENAIFVPMGKEYM